MSYKPNDFYMTVFDFFTVLLPGALFLYLVNFNFDLIAPGLGKTQDLKSEQGLVFFAVCSYIAGHFIFAIGATLDYPYKHWRRLFHHKKCEALFQEAKSKVKTINEDPVITPYKWCKSFVEIKAYTQSKEIARLDSTSKLFRSLTVLMLLLAVSMYSAGTGRNAFLLILISAFSFWRYANQRQNRDDLAYMYFLHSQKPGSGTE